MTLVLCIPAFAQEDQPPSQQPLVLTDEQGGYPLGRHMDILEDPGGELNIDDVTSPEYAVQFTSSQEDVPVYGYTGSVFWLRLRLSSEASRTNLWLLEASFPNLNYVDLYLPSNGGGYTVKESGVLRPFKTRDIPYYHVVFELPLAYQDEDNFYIRVKSGSSMTLGFTLWSPEAFALNKIAAILYLGLFYGGLLIMLGYHLFLFLWLREAVYFYFVLFVAGAILFFATYEGVADQYLWPGWSDKKLYLLVITMALFFMAALKFSDAFLEQKTRAPGFHRGFNLFLGFWGLTIVILPFSSFLFMAQLTSPFVIITPGFAALAGFYNLRKGYPLARFYLISWLGFLLGLIVVELVRSGVLPSTPITEWSYHAGLIWLVVMWSLALADRINLLKKETEEANQKLLQSQSQLSQTLEGMPLGVVVYGVDRKPTYANPRAVSILSNPDRGIQPGIAGRRTLREAMKYFSFRVVGSDQEYPVERMPVWQAFEGNSVSVDDIEADLIDRRVPLEIWAKPVKDESGRVESVVAAFQDISERRQMQSELEAHRHQLEALVEQRTEQLQAEISERRRLEDMLRFRLEWLVVVNQVYQAVSNTRDLPQAYQRFVDLIKKLFDASDALLAEYDTQGQELRLLAHSCSNGSHPNPTGAVLQFTLAAPDGRPFEPGKPVILRCDQLAALDGPLGAHFRDSNSQIIALVPMSCQGNTLGLLGLEFQEAEKHFSADEIAQVDRICLDILQVKEKALLAEQTQTLVATEERNRLARDLHDSVTQMLFAASLVAEVLPQILRRDAKGAQASLEELRRLTRGALAEMRTLLLELRPAVVIKTPLSELLAQLTEAIASRANLPFQLFIEQIPPLPEDVHVGFYRIAQESLNNVVKHAQASQVSVSLSATPMPSDPTQPWEGEVRLMVRDDGRGFTLQEVGAQSLGLGIMRERAAAIGGVRSVESQPGGGTTVTLIWHT